MSFQSTTSFTSYHEWRKACNYSKAQNTLFVDLISCNSESYQFSQCLEILDQCLDAGIPPNDILISMLYLSCHHHFRLHALNIIKYILNHYYGSSACIDLYSTCISQPQYQIPHIAAMNDDISLLQVFYNLDGDVDVKDGRGLLPIAIAVTDRYIQICEVLLWMNSTVPLKQLSVLNEMETHYAVPFIAVFSNFVNVIERSQQFLKNALHGIAMPDELSRVLSQYTLPLNAYRGVKQLLSEFKQHKLSEWSTFEQVASSLDGSANIGHVGIDFESELSLITKHLTKIEVKPRRKMDRAQYKHSASNKLLKWTVLSGFIMASGSILWKQYK